MGQAQSTQGGRPREFSKVDDTEFDFDITKKIKTGDESEDSGSIPGLIAINYQNPFSIFSDILLLLYYYKL